MARVFVLESPSPDDLLSSTNERSSLEQVCRQFNHDVASFLLLDKRELRATLKYVGSIGGFKVRNKRAPLFIHISSHGDKRGLYFGMDHVRWKELSDLISDAYKELDDYKGPVILILSACNSKPEKLTKHLKKIADANGLDNPPEFILSFASKTVYWQDAVVTWTVLYKRANNLDWNSTAKGRSRVQRLLDGLYNADLGKLIYFRWDKDRHLYRWYRPKKPRKAQ